MATVRSRMARRGRTGRKASTKQHVKRAIQVHHRHHRRYAGTRGGKSTAPKRRTGGISTAKPRVNKTGRHRTFKGRAKPGTAAKRVRNPLGRHARRHFKGRKKVTMRKGLHRRFLGRKKLMHKRAYHGRRVKPGQHRRFLGRKKSTHKRAYFGRKPKTVAAPISAASYLSMF